MKVKGQAMFILYLNPMTANAERCTPICRAETREELERFVESERVEPYRDDGWYKVFRKGGPLEWYNPPDVQPFFFEFYKDIGTLSDWIAEAQQSWQQMLRQVPPTPTSIVEAQP